LGQIVVCADLSEVWSVFCLSAGGKSHRYREGRADRQDYANETSTSGGHRDILAHRGLLSAIRISEEAVHGHYRSHPFG
jgi:hypothetical protein